MSTTFSVIDSLATDHVDQLVQLYRREWWTADRALADVELMLRSTPVVVGAVTAGDELVGFARVLTDRTYYAVLLDVIVREDHRGRGVGALLMDTVVGHPALGRARRLTLKCREDKINFYARWGFTTVHPLPPIDGIGPGAEMSLNLSAASAG